MPRISLPASLLRFGELPDQAMVGVWTVAALYDISTSTVWRHARNGQIPAPRRFGGSARWNVGELRAALAATAPENANGR